MKTCPNCKAILDDDLNFCTNCGTNLNSRNSIPNQTPISYPFSTNYQNYQYPFTKPNQTPPPIGLALIVLYECLIGIVLILFGIVSFSLIGNNYPSLAGNSQSTYIIGGVIACGWGILGIIGGILFFRGHIIGLVMSLLFLISTGVILFILTIPTIVMIISCIYLVLDKKIRIFLKRKKEITST